MPRLTLNRTTLNQVLPAALALGAIALLPSAALAHAVETNYIVEASQVNFQSSFSTGEPLEGATVEIYAPNQPEQPWIELTTDPEGRFAFAPDPALTGEWEIVIQKEGHGDIWTVPVEQTGIAADKISAGPGSDIHYAAVELPASPASSAAPLALALGLGSAATVCAIAGRRWAARRR